MQESQASFPPFTKPGPQSCKYSSSTQVFDSGLNIWYASHDLPEDDSEGLNQILHWKDDLLWINWPGKLWKFEVDTWSLLREIDTRDFWDFAFTVPNDFVPDCANER